MPRLFVAVACAAMIGFSGFASAQLTQQRPAAEPRQPTGQSVEFKTETEAKGHCPSDRVVWANLNTKVYHYQGTHNYGKTLKGAYMCERDAGTAGLRAAQNEKAK